MKQTDELGTSISNTEAVCEFLNEKHGGGGDFCAIYQASHLNLPWFNLLLTPDRRRAELICQLYSPDCALASEKMERSEKERNAEKKTIWLCRLMDASWAFSPLYLPLSLLIASPFRAAVSPFSKLSDGINQRHRPAENAPTHSSELATKND